MTCLLEPDSSPDVPGLERVRETAHPLPELRDLDVETFVELFARAPTEAAARLFAHTGCNWTEQTHEEVARVDPTRNRPNQHHSRVIPPCHRWHRTHVHPTWPTREQAQQPRRNGTAHSSRRSGEPDKLRLISPTGDVIDLAAWAQKEWTPRFARDLVDPEIPALAVGRWLSPRTREVLRTRGIGFVDLVLTSPTMVIRAEGAQRDPQPKPPETPTVRGPRAWTLLRTVAEVEPSTGVPTSSCSSPTTGSSSSAPGR